MNVDYINPFLLSTMSVFEQMLGVELVREAPFIRKDFAPQYEITGMIGLSGKTTGTVAVSLPGEMALAITEKLLGERPSDVNAQAVDAVGEMTNMIAGAAKARLEHLQLSLGLPTVVLGRSTRIAFPSRATPISIPFSSPLGPVVVEVGILA
jgi:chemotaxis protein CheX